MRLEKQKVSARLEKQKVSGKVDSLIIGWTCPVIARLAGTFCPDGKRLRLAWEGVIRFFSDVNDLTFGSWLVQTRLLWTQCLFFFKVPHKGGRRCGRQRKCWTGDVKEWTSPLVPELLTKASCRKDLKRISAESSVMSPRQPSRPSD